MSGNHSRRKGHNFEREMVHAFARVFGEEHVRRGLQYRDGADCPDVIAPALWIECKRGARTNPRAALAQAQAASETSKRWPVAVCKDDRAEPFVAMTLDDFLDLLKEWWDMRMVDAGPVREIGHRDMKPVREPDEVDPVSGLARITAGKVAAGGGRR